MAAAENLNAKNAPGSILRGRALNYLFGCADDFGSQIDDAKLSQSSAFQKLVLALPRGQMLGTWLPLEWLRHACYGRSVSSRDIKSAPGPDNFRTLLAPTISSRPEPVAVAFRSPRVVSHAEHYRCRYSMYSGCHRSTSRHGAGVKPNIRLPTQPPPMPSSILLTSLHRRP